MRRLFLIPTALGCIALADAAAAQRAVEPLACGGVHRIARGDTLQRLAVRAYGPEASYQTLWRHNRDRLGLRNPSLIEVGQEIEIPCLGADGQPVVAADAGAVEAGPVEDGASEAGVAEAGVAEVGVAEVGVAEVGPVEAGVAEADIAEAGAGVGASVGGGAAAMAEPPVAEDDAAGRNPDRSVDRIAEAAPAPAAGAAAEPDNAEHARAESAAPAELAATAPDPTAPSAPTPASGGAVAADPGAAPAPAPTLVVAEGAELGAALVAEALATPSRPGAPATPAPDPGGAPLLLALAPAGGCAGADDCAGLTWSGPIVQALAVAHTRRDKGWLTGLDGMRVCRAADLPPSLTQGAQSVIERPTAVACLRAVAVGDADVALTPAAAADAALRDRLLAVSLVEQHALARLIDVRAAADPENPQAVAMLQTLDAALARMRAGDGWFDAVSAQLSGGDR